MATLLEGDDAEALSSEVDDEDFEGVSDDADDDIVSDVFVSLFDTRTFDNITDMFNRCKDMYRFDVWQLQQQHDLDFLGLVKLINYVRKCVSQGNLSPDVTSAAVFDGDEYLLPVMENDAVLYSLEDILVQARSETKTQIEELQEQMTALQARFDAYRETVTEHLRSQLDTNIAEIPLEESLPNGDAKPLNSIDEDYFLSYSSNAIHETMLKDKVRTDAYRDFIYDNKDLFRDKIVLDVGCGTGILSMFCAKAGAKKVISVDNSDIIDVARRNIRLNNLEDCIQCVRGKIEDVALPVKQVDIIVSEWMGYCLLYESMLDSVIHARDKYLALGGLMVPSHATLKIAPLIDSDLRLSHVEYWNDVYGFAMEPMLDRVVEECLIKTASPGEVAGTGAIFKILDLHQVSIRDLEFQSRFELTKPERAGQLDGFLIWFDIFFARSSNATINEFEVEKAKSHGMTAFSTGPFTESTHWQQGACFSREPGPVLRHDSLIKGDMIFTKADKDVRALKIRMEWQVDALPAQKQLWHLS